MVLAYVFNIVVILVFNALFNALLRFKMILTNTFGSKEIE